ncbi:hypothetical protein LIT35_02315 [Peribacillus asahii]|nr:hypothetical protein LIT35_02315 [Peribacillus asahii]
MTSTSKPFCSSCTRARLSSNGFNLKSLIGSEAGVIRCYL